MAPAIVQATGVELCVETFGAPTDPAVLLIMGAGASMDWWEDDFCTRLAAGSRFVIRYDHRDTGRSVTYAPGAPGYTGDDLIADAAGVRDALGVDDWSDRAAVIDYAMDLARACASRSRPFDEAGAGHELARRDWDVVVPAILRVTRS